MQQLQQILQDHAQIGASFVRLIGDRQRGGGFAGHHGLQQIEHRVPVREAQHIRDLRRRDDPVCLRHRLIQDRQPVAHRSIGRARDQVQRGRFDLHVFLVGDAGEMRVQLGHLHAAERKTLAARQHRDRDLAQFRRREHEFYVRRRFFQRFQQRVEGVAGEHVHFVDDEHLGAGLHRAEACGLDDFPHVVHAGAGRRVHFDHVGMAVGQDADAVGAYAAGIRCRPAVAVHAGAV